MNGETFRTFETHEFGSFRQKTYPSVLLLARQLPKDVIQFKRFGRDIPTVSGRSENLDL